MRWSVIAIALLFAPTALAAQGTVDLQADVPLAFAGDVSARADDARLLMVGDDGRTSVRVDVEEGTLYRVIHRAFGYVRTHEADAEIVWSDRVDIVPIDMAGATLWLEDRRDGFQALVHGASIDFDASHLMEVALRQEPQLVRNEVPASIALRVNPPSDESAFEHQIPAGLHDVDADAGKLLADGAFTAYLDEGVFTLQTHKQDVVRAHFRIENRPGGAYDPLANRWFGPGTHKEYIDEHLVLRATDARMDVRFDGSDVHILADAMQLLGEGTLSVEDASGTVLIEDEDGLATHALDNDDLVLKGAFDLATSQANAAYTRTNVDGSGDFVVVSYGSVHAEYPWGAIAASLGALLVAGLAWAAMNAKAVVGLAGYARVQGDDVLQHDARGALYEMVKSQPGATFHELGEQVPYGASTLNYHLRVLEKNGFLTRVKDGRYARFFDRQSGLYSSDRKTAVSALRNDTTAAIAEVIVAHPGVAQCELAEVFGLAPSTINWHIKRLADAGLVDRRRESHYARYYPGSMWANLPQEEQARHGVLLAA